jgi:hypothetical protein
MLTKRAIRSPLASFTVSPSLDDWIMNDDYVSRYYHQEGIEPNRWICSTEAKEVEWIGMLA